MSVSSSIKTPFVVKTLSVYTFLVSTLFFVQTFVAGFKLPGEFRADFVGFALVVVLGVLILPIWFIARSLTSAALAIWWLPQLLEVTKNVYLPSGAVMVTSEWRVVMIFFVGPNFGVEISSATYRLFHVNILAIAALAGLLWVHLNAHHKPRDEGKSQLPAASSDMRD